MSYNKNILSTTHLHEYIHTVKKRIPLFKKYSFWETHTFQKKMVEMYIFSITVIK